MIIPFQRSHFLQNYRFKQSCFLSILFAKIIFKIKEFYFSFSLFSKQEKNFQNKKNFFKRKEEFLTKNGNRSLLRFVNIRRNVKGNSEND